MKKSQIQLSDTVYYNTTGAFGVPISLKGTVIDIGKLWIWVHFNGNLSYNNVLSNELSQQPLYKVTNDKLDSYNF